MNPSLKDNILQGLGGGQGTLQLPHNLQGPGEAVRQDVGRGAELRVCLQGKGLGCVHVYSFTIIGCIRT